MKVLPIVFLLTLILGSVSVCRADQHSSLSSKFNYGTSNEESSGDICAPVLPNQPEAQLHIYHHAVETYRSWHAELKRASDIMCNEIVLMVPSLERPGDSVKKQENKVVVYHAKGVATPRCGLCLQNYLLDKEPRVKMPTAIDWLTFVFIVVMVGFGVNKLISHPPIVHSPHRSWQPTQATQNSTSESPEVHSPAPSPSILPPPFTPDLLPAPPTQGDRTSESPALYSEPSPVPYPSYHSLFPSPPSTPYPAPSLPQFSRPPPAQLPPRHRLIVDNPDPRSTPTRTRLGSFGPPRTAQKAPSPVLSVVSQASFPLPESFPGRKSRSLEDEPLSQFHSEVKPVCETTQEQSTPLSDFHLFLDIDGTLVHTVPKSGQNLMGRADFQIEQLGLASFKRPDLEQFMAFCFSNFKSVSLWTAGVAEYAQAVAQNIAPPGCEFKFVLSRDTLHEHPSKKPGACAKNLSAMWTFNEHFRNANITRENCLIIDDTPEVCAWNEENAIIVPSWNAHTRHSIRDRCFARLYESFAASRVANARCLCSEVSARLRATAA